ncbi:YhjD/YihY/BrkB family envelope integrity protein [Streptomyces sp. NPDC053431]|uniref:YhjD/YihY/BrkB family envelope integrity protein n=1 Tax=Streptomyces sp. NPDC053431 TaxID=3365703 RepID=UPI0037D0AD2A
MRTTHHHTRAARSRSTEGNRPAEGKSAGRVGVRQARRTAEWGRAKYVGSWAENLWRRLDAVDFINQAILLAATLLLCAVPFMLIASALAGRSAVSTLSVRLGLGQEAANDLGHLFASSAATSAAITGLSWVFFVLAGIAVSASLQKLYQRVFDQRPQGVRDRLCALVWLALAMGWVALGSTVGHALHESSPVLWWIINVPGFVAFFWFTMWLLLGGQVGRRRLLPCAVATAAFWIGMLVVFRFTFSGMVTSSDEKYGPIGVVFSLMSFFIAIGVVIILGAATGMMWHERGMSFRAATTKIRRGHDYPDRR